MSPLEHQRRLRLAAYRLYVRTVLRRQGWGGGVLPLVDVSPTRKESK